MLTFFLLSVNGLLEIFQETFPEEFDEYGFCERHTVTITNYTLRTMIQLVGFTGRMSPLYKVHRESQLCEIMTQFLTGCFEGIDTKEKITKEMHLCNAAYFQNYDCERSSRDIKHGTLLNDTYCLTQLSCPPVVVDLAFHEGESFRDLTKLPEVETGSNCSKINYAVRITDATQNHCNEANLVFLRDWLHHAPHVKLLEIHDWKWKCHLNSNEMLFDRLVHTKLEFLRFTNVVTDHSLRILSKRLLDMQDLNFLQFQYSSECCVDIQLPQTIRGVRLKGFNVIEQLPPNLEYLAFHGSVVKSNVVWDIPQTLTYMALHITKNKDVELLFNFPQFSNLQKLVVVFKGFNKHKIKFLGEHFPRLKRLRVEIYDQNGVGMFDSTDLKNLLESIRQGHFPELNDLRLQNAQLTGSIETVIQIATERRLLVLDLENCGLSKSDGKDLLQAFKSGFIPKVSDRAKWLLDGNRELDSLGPELFKSAESCGIALYGIPSQDGWTSHTPLSNDDEF